VSHAHARHRKSSRSTPARSAGAVQHRRSAPRKRNKTARVAVAAVAGSALLVSAWLGTAHWLTLHHPTGALNQADVLGLQSAAGNQGLTSQRPAAPAAHGTQRLDTPRAGATLQPKIAGVTQQPKIVSVAVSRPGRPSYVNPLRSVSGLVPERIDEGVDFGGTGPVYALGDAVVTNAGQNAGWPGGGWITYQLTDGPDQGLMPGASAAAARSRPWSGSTSTNCSWCWAYRPHLMLATPRTGFFRPTTRPSGSSRTPQPSSAYTSTT